MGRKNMQTEEETGLDADPPTLTLLHSAHNSLSRLLGNPGSATAIDLLEIHRAHATLGSINYSGVLFRRTGLLKGVLARDLQELIVARAPGQADRARFRNYRKMCRIGLIDLPEVLGVLKAHNKRSPKRLYRALRGRSSPLRTILRVLGVPWAQVLVLVARILLSQNKHRIFDYIHEMKYSRTLKYLARDAPGAQVLQAAVHQIFGGKEASRPDYSSLLALLNRTITLYIDLSKIERSLSLLTPIVSDAKTRISQLLAGLDPPECAELAVSVVVSRFEEISRHLPPGLEASLNLLDSPDAPCGDAVDFLVSLTALEEFIDAFGLFISRDLVMGARARTDLLELMERKIGAFRFAGIRIMQRDFGVFKLGRGTVGRQRVLSDVGISRIKCALDPECAVGSFVFSEHYWPEHNFLSSPLRLDGPGAECSRSCGPEEKGTGAAREELEEGIDLLYSRNHTYADITVEHNGARRMYSVPIVYLEFLSRHGVGGVDLAVPRKIREFWRTMTEMSQ